jgi:hypothetical protein
VPRLAGSLALAPGPKDLISVGLLKEWNSRPTSLPVSEFFNDADQAANIGNLDDVIKKQTVKLKVSPLFNGCLRYLRCA